MTCHDMARLRATFSCRAKPCHAMRHLSYATVGKLILSCHAMIMRFRMPTCHGRRHQCNALPRLMGISLLRPLPLLTCRARPSTSPPRPCTHLACTPQVPMPVCVAAVHVPLRAWHAPHLFLHATHRMRLVLSPSMLRRPQWLQLLTCGRWAASCMSVPAGGRRLRHPAPSSSTRSFWNHTRSCLRVRGEGPEGAGKACWYPCVSSMRRLALSVVLSMPWGGGT